MGKYTIITEVGNALVNLLRLKLVPDTVQNPDTIGLCSPWDKGDFIVGIHLYDIEESTEIRANTMISAGIDERKHPPAYVSLYYMITVYSAGDVKFRSSEEQKILGKILQVLNDCPCFDKDTLESVPLKRPMDITFRMQSMSLEDKMRIFSAPNTGYKLSLFYKAAPIEIESMRSQHIPRVTDIDFTIYEQEKRE